MAAAHDVNISELETADLAHYCRELATQARRAAAEVARVQGAQKNAWLIQSADAVERRTHEILQANDRDMEAAAVSAPSAAHLDRLRLTPDRLGAVAEGLRQIAALPDPVGKVLDGGLRPNGLRITKVSVPLGVVFFIYESRPNVTADAAAIAIKSGNAIVLRGGTEALHSNVILHRILQEKLVSSGLPAEAVQYVRNTDRAAVGQFLRMPKLIDLAIPRGGEALIRRVSEEAQMPVLKHDMGNCHVYVDRAADFDMACRILLNAKCQRPGVCNAAESLLVHAEVASKFLPKAGELLRQRKVEVRGCDRTRELIPGSLPATEADYRAEYLDLVLSVKVVENLDEAIAHVNCFGSHHTDSIVTNDLDAARRFTEAVDSSAVLVNASTRFNDGCELGLGAEIGISTGKFHARGPCGLLELTSYKYVIHGDGHIR
jgi:glutamate-5-semialdehyde dehydrogenase